MVVSFGSGYVGIYPGVQPRLLIRDEDREDLSSYRTRGGYADGLEGEELIEATEDVDLRGRGGAAFPMGAKLRSIIDRPAPRFAVANGEEGEPASYKDRWLMRMRPHLVLDGLLRCSRATGAEEAIVYLSDPRSEVSMLEALDELGPLDLPVSVRRVESAYVAGEATAVVRALNGGPAKPTDKPPFPFDQGVNGSTTLISNVETLANMPSVAVHGAAAHRDGGGRGRETGTLLMTISGAVDRPGLYEVPFGVELGPTVESMAGLPEGVRGFLMGGFFAGIANPRAAQFSISYEDMRAEASGLGCGAVVVLGPDDCPVLAAADVMGYLARENARQCGACINGTPAMAGVVAALAAGEATDDELAKLDRWSHTLRGRGACGLLDAVCNMAATLNRDFAREVEAHQMRACTICREGGVAADGSSRFALSWESFKNGGW